MFLAIQNCSHGRIDPTFLYARAHHRNVIRNIGVTFASASNHLTSPLRTSSPQVPRMSTLLNEPVAMRTEGTAVMRIITLRRARGGYAAPLLADVTIFHGFGPGSTTSRHLNPSTSPQQASIDGSSAGRRTPGTAGMRTMASRSAVHLDASHLDAASFRADETMPPGVGTPVMRLVVFRRAAWQAEASRRIADGTANVSSYLLFPFFIFIFLKICKNSCRGGCG